MNNSLPLGFMVTLNCDLECPFCMYNSSPKVQDQMPFGALQNFISTIQPGRINSFGFYGGDSGRSSSAPAQDASANGVTRGGFGAFARAFGFSGRS